MAGTAIGAFLVGSMASGSDARPLKPPVARCVPHAVVLHNETLNDDYFWLRQKDDTEVTAYLQAENAYTNAVMKPTEALQETLYREILGRIQETDLSVPYRKGDYFYYSRTEEGKQYPIHCRKGGTPSSAQRRRLRGDPIDQGSLDTPEEVTLDLNELAKGEKFLALGVYEVSDDGNLLAYTTDVTGFREYTLYVKDLRTGTLGPEKIPKVNAVAWAADNRTLFYVTEDHAKRPYRLLRHALSGTDDRLLLEEKDERFRVRVWRTRSKAFLLAGIGSLTASEVHYLPADQPRASLQVVLPREADHEYYVDHHGDHFYIRTNSGGRNFRVVTAPADDPRRENWKEIIPHRDDVMIEGLDLFAGHAVVRERKEGLAQLQVRDLRSDESHYIEFPEVVYAAFPSTNAEFHTGTFRFSYQSFSTPPSIFDYDLESRERKLLKEEPVLGGYKRARYQSERVYATAPDGTRVPISLVYRKDMRKTGRNPLLLAGYGAYGASLSASFAPARISLLDRGVIFAVAHIRGGGEMGKKWHDQGRIMSKRNTFTDFIAAAEHLVKEKYTSRKHLAIEGGSAGGLLIGAVVNMRPDLCRLAILHVPFVDVINTMSDASLPLTVTEYEEWGNPQIKEQYDYIKTYCPYTNIARKSYPAMLVKTSLNDSQVMYWEPAKYVAKLRATKRDRNPLLFKINMAGGHGGHSGRYDRFRETAFDYAFILTQMGIRQ